MYIEITRIKNFLT